MDGAAVEDWDVGDSLGPLVRAGRRILGALSGPRLSPLDEVRLQLLHIELQRARGGPIPVAVEWRQLVGDLGPRRDFLVFGDRGAGKTAAAASIVQAWAQVHGVRPAALGVPGWAAGALGLEVVGRASEVRDAAVLVDEAGLRLRERGRRAADEWAEALDLARHRNVSWVWATPAMAGFSREVLRHEAVWVAKRYSPGRAVYDREESAEDLARLLGVQASLPMAEDPSLAVVRLDGFWGVTRVPLPSGWSDRVSVMHGG